MVQPVNVLSSQHGALQSGTSLVQPSGPRYGTTPVQSSGLCIEHLSSPMFALPEMSSNGPPSSPVQISPLLCESGRRSRSLGHQTTSGENLNLNTSNQSATSGSDHIRGITLVPRSSRANCPFEGLQSTYT
ncbi:hypothetical protein V6N12_066733 [Hibiscus sabdariffa]|uniref:Uncharacterized protein n=1 Tax=Hibiscus sabdariffa TaxID=183260 RepID=A0ABR2BDL4_9ROSI